MKLEDDASKDTISEEEYVKGIFVLEWRYAAQRERRFYVEVFLPHAKRYRIPTDSARWYFSDKDWRSAEALFADFTDKNQYPWKHYSPQYYWHRFGVWVPIVDD